MLCICIVLFLIQGCSVLGGIEHYFPISLKKGSRIDRAVLLPLMLLLKKWMSIPQVVNYSESRTAEEICESASKMITFIDLAGHHKYLKTTIFGLTSYCPDFAMLVVSANTGIGKFVSRSYKRS